MAAGFQFGPWTCPWTEAFFLSPLSLAVVNTSPIRQGHCLVLSRRAAPRLSDLSAAEAADLWDSVRAISPALERHFGATAMTIALQDGPAAGQTVPHVHVHLIPRVGGDFKRNDEVYEKLDSTSAARTVEPEEERPKRSAEEMKKEAFELRPLFEKVSLPFPEGM